MSDLITASKYCDSVFDGTHDTPKPVEAGRLLITSKHISGGKLDVSTAYMISEKDYCSIQKRSSVSQWDILFSMIGSVGEVYLEKNDNITYAIKNIGVFSCKDEYRAKWLYYYLLSPSAKNHIIRYLNGAVQKFLPLGALRSFPVIPFNDDKKILVGVLENIDRKIEINRGLSLALVEMSKSIYDYWFMQFNFPISTELAIALGDSTLEGRPYKTSGGKMVDHPTQKRKIPEGWLVKRLDELAKVKAGGDRPALFSTKITDTFSIPIYSNGIDDEGLYGYTTEATINSPSVTISARGSIGYTVLRMKPFTPIIRLIVVTPRIPNSIQYVYEYIKSMGHSKSGSVQQQLTAPLVSSMKILEPSRYVLEKYAEVTTPITREIEIIKEENVKLSELRDWLLPMLMNGQVTVK
ncbi:MAG: restriction endonuclease subunit S [Candidatus Marinimicrobia bacterium]|nr:restriction endonuclease subunit S [Candidatus Neomarinimicrobiota bacterium]